MKRAGLFCGALALALAISPTVMASSTMAKEAPAACTTKVPTTGDLASWNAPVEKTSAGSADGAEETVLLIGQAAHVALLRTPEVKYTVPPEKPGRSASHGGLFQFAVKDAGTYRVALGSAAWIDVVGTSGESAGKAVTSTAHGHGPDCSGIRKMVDFALTPGRYTLQIAANNEPKTTVLVAELP